MWREILNTYIQQNTQFTTEETCEATIYCQRGMRPEAGKKYQLGDKINRGNVKKIVSLDLQKKKRHSVIRYFEKNHGKSTNLETK